MGGLDATVGGQPGPATVTPGPDQATRIATAATSGEAERLALALASEGISSAVVPDGPEWWLVVRAPDAGRASAVVEAYQSENAAPQPSVAAPVVSSRWADPAIVTTLIAMAGLVAWHAVLATAPAGAAITERGVADSTAIARGEAWRAVTAITLHADATHVLANALAGSLWIAPVLQAMGPGIGALAVLLSAAAGNLSTAWLSGPGHASLGASSAVFAALGILAALGALRSESSRWPPLVPLASAVVLLSLFGASPHADVLGHLFGFMWGLVAGLGYGLFTRRAATNASRHGALAQALAASAALGLVALAWRLALS